MFCFLYTAMILLLTCNNITFSFTFVPLLQQKHMILH